MWSIQGLLRYTPVVVISGLADADRGASTSVKLHLDDYAVALIRGARVSLLDFRGLSCQT